MTPHATPAERPGPVQLSAEEVAILAEPCACGHEPDDHGSVGCWTCLDHDLECAETFMGLVAVRVGRIVATRVEAAVLEVWRQYGFPMADAAHVPLTARGDSGGHGDAGEADRAGGGE